MVTRKKALPFFVFLFFLDKQKAYLNTLMYSKAISPHVICWKKGVINVYRINATTLIRSSYQLKSRSSR